MTATANPLPFLPSFTRRPDLMYPAASLQTPFGPVAVIFIGPNEATIYAGEERPALGYVAPLKVNNIPVKVQSLRFMRRSPEDVEAREKWGEWRWDSSSYYSLKRGDNGGPATSNQIAKVRKALEEALQAWGKTPEAKTILREAEHAHLWNEVRQKEADVERALDQAREAAAEVAKAAAALREFEAGGA